MGAQIVSGKPTQALNSKLYQIDADGSISSDERTRNNINKVLSRLDQIEID